MSSWVSSGRFADSTPRKRSGATFTPPALAELLAQRVLAGDEARPSLVIADPACGDGALMEAARAVRQAQGRFDDRWLAMDTNPEAVAQVRRRFGLTPGTSVRHADFLEPGSTMGDVDRIIANPPWVRTQVLGSARARELAQRFGLRGRVDLAQAFVLAMVDALRPGGRAAILIPNKLLQTRGAAAFRQQLRTVAQILEVLDLGDTRLFDAAVLPAVLVLEKASHRDAPVPFRSVYSVHDPPVDVPSISTIAGIWNHPGMHKLPDGRVFEVRAGELDICGTHETWQRGGAAVRAWLTCVEAHTALWMRDLGTVRVGIKSTADPVFVSPDWSTMPEERRPELLRPLTTHHRARAFHPLPSDRGRMVLYPHENVDGQRRPVELHQYPKSQAWLEAHRDRLASRKYVQEAGRAWFAIWVPHDPDGWAGPKLVFRDIAPRSTCWLDTEGTVVNGDCYWLAPKAGVPPDHLYLALAVANSTFLDAWYDRVCNNRLYAGRRRYLAQFVSAYPLPDPALPSSRRLMEGARRLVERLQIESLESCEAAVAELDSQVWDAFGLDSTAPLP